MSENIKLSILVCGLYERMPYDHRSDHSVIWSLERQSLDKPVELLTLYDNRKMSVGRKRSILLAAAQGEYFAYCDDDDEVAPDYVARLLEAIGKAKGSDVICFRQDAIRGDLGGRVEVCRYGLGLAYRSGVGPDGGMWWEGKPAHTMVWRTDLVQDIPFPDGDFGEDMWWVTRACGRAKTEYWIPNWTGYTYHFNPEKSRTRGK